MRHLQLVESASSVATDPAALQTALRTIRSYPVGTETEEALLIVELMDARASQMPADYRLRSTLVRCVTSLARVHGRRHLSPLPSP
jgi:hypothetical protein